MTRVTVDRTVSDKLARVDSRVELCDEQGRILGYFVPSQDPALYSMMEPQISEEELQRRLAEGGGRPLSEILDDLRKRAS